MGRTVPWFLLSVESLGCLRLDCECVDNLSPVESGIGQLDAKSHKPFRSRTYLANNCVVTNDKTSLMTSL